jgi:hypothetical protein
MQSKKTILIWIFPLATLLLGFALYRQMAPIYSNMAGFDQDPAYVYLLSGLGLLEGYMPSHVDHPGTPLQVLVAFVIALKWVIMTAFGFEKELLVASVMRAPEAYIQATSMGLLTITCMAQFYIGIRILKYTRNLALAIFAQTTPIGFAVVVPNIVYLSPEALLFATSLVFMGVAAPLLFQRQALSDDNLNKIKIQLGLVCGFGIAVKLTFIPLLGVLLLLGSTRRVLGSLKFVAVALAICLLPIAGRIPFLVKWSYSLITQSGLHSSAGGFSEILAAAGKNVNVFLHSYPLYYAVGFVLCTIIVFNLLYSLCCAVTSVLTAGQPKGETFNRIRTLVAKKSIELSVPLCLLVVMLVHTVMVLKYPLPRYLIPSLPIGFMGAIWIVKYFSSQQYAGGRTNILSLPLLGVGLITAVAAAFNAYQSLEIARTNSAQVMQKIDEAILSRSDSLVFGTYGCNSLKCALSFGLSYNASLVEKSEAYLSNFGLYNIWDKTLYVYGVGKLLPQQADDLVSSGREILIITPVSDRVNKFITEPINVGPTQSVYRVLGIKQGIDE